MQNGGINLKRGFKKRIFLYGKIAGKRISRKKNEEYGKNLYEYFKAREGGPQKTELRIKIKQLVSSINKENMFKKLVTGSILRSALHLFSAVLNKGKNNCI